MDVYYGSYTFISWLHIKVKQGRGLLQDVQSLFFSSHKKKKKKNGGIIVANVSKSNYPNTDYSFFVVWYVNQTQIFWWVSDVPVYIGFVFLLLFFFLTFSINVWANITPFCPMRTSDNLLLLVSTIILRSCTVWEFFFYLYFQSFILTTWASWTLLGLHFWLSWVCASWRWQLEEERSKGTVAEERQKELTVSWLRERDELKKELTEVKKGKEKAERDLRTTKKACDTMVRRRIRMIRAGKYRGSVQPCGWDSKEWVASGVSKVYCSD